MTSTNRLISWGCSVASVSGQPARFRVAIDSAPEMSNNFRVLNITTGESMKCSQAKRRIADCTLAWVKENETVRNLTLAESIAARNEAAKNREPLASAEIPGVKWEPPMSDTAFRSEHREALRMANQFCAEAR